MANGRPTLLIRRQSGRSDVALLG